MRSNYIPRRGFYSIRVGCFRASAIFWLFILAVMACQNDDPFTDETDSDLYIATTFIEAGQLDGGVDILENGGMLSVRLWSDFKVEGQILIPDNIGSNFAPVDTTFYGEYSLDGDTVRFLNTETLLDWVHYKFIRSDTQLVSITLTGYAALEKIILTKQH